MVLRGSHSTSGRMPLLTHIWEDPVHRTLVSSFMILPLHSRQAAWSLEMQKSLGMSVTDECVCRYAFSSFNNVRVARPSAMHATDFLWTCMVSAVTFFLHRNRAFQLCVAAGGAASHNLAKNCHGSGARAAVPLWDQTPGFGVEAEERPLFVQRC